MKNISTIPVDQLRDAASAWRNNDRAAAMSAAGAGFLRWLLPEPNMSIHDRVDDLIGEIERLRALADSIVSQVQVAHGVLDCKPETVKPT